MVQQVKDPALSLQQLMSLLWSGFFLCLGNSICCRHVPLPSPQKKKKKKKKVNFRSKGFLKHVGFEVVAR